MIQGPVWITGAGSGIGLALARAVSAQGIPVLASGRRAQPLIDLAAHCPHVTPLPLDVADAATVRALHTVLQPVETAILCAGTHHPTPGTAFDADVVRALVDTNLMGVVQCLEAVLGPMLERRRGRVVLVSSVAGYRGLPGAAGYCASKAAVIALAQSLRLDLADCGIDVRLVNPGFVDTPLTRKNDFPMPDIITAEEAARFILTGLAGRSFEIAFPPRFARLMKLARLLPDRLYFPLVRKVTGC